MVVTRYEMYGIASRSLRASIVVGEGQPSVKLQAVALNVQVNIAQLDHLHYGNAFIPIMKRQNVVIPTFSRILQNQTSLFSSLKSFH